MTAQLVIRAFLLSGLGAASLPARPVPTSSSTPAASASQTAATAAAEPEPVIQLSPFEVTASRDLGYQATETLAGTRLRTDLRDLGATISVATKEFMRDLGATDNQSLLPFLTGTEVGGVTGNFAGLGNDTAVLSDLMARVNGANATTRIRGLETADNTRGYFQTLVPWDSYNSSRIEIQRGVNSILAGNGSGAGIINSTPDDATIGRNEVTLTTRVGSEASYRGTLNFNRSFGGQFAVRGALLYDHRNYRQKPAYTTDRRRYAAVRWEPESLRKNDAHTSLKLKFEDGRIDANNPHTSPPEDQISPWFLQSPVTMKTPDGLVLGTLQPMKSHAGYDPFVTGLNNAALIAANPGRKDIGATVAGTANYEPWVFAGNSTSVLLDAIFADPTSSQMSTYLATRTAPFLYNAINAAGARDGTIAGLREPGTLRLFNLPEYAQFAGFLYQQQGVYRGTTLTDPTVFDFYHRLPDGPNKREGQTFHAFNVSLDQTFWHDRAGFQLAYDRQTRARTVRDFLGGSPTLTLDILKYLPVAPVDPATGLLQPLPNPNFGRPFVSGVFGYNNWRDTNEGETWRLTPFAEFDFARLTKKENGLTKLLGRHRLTGLAEGYRATSTVRGLVRYALDGATSNLIEGPNQRLETVNRTIATISYLGPSLAGASSLAGARLSNITALQQPRSGPAWYFDSTYLPGAPAPSVAWAAGGLTGLSPSQNGVAAASQVQAENPANYAGWNTPEYFPVLNADFDNLEPLTFKYYLARTVTRSWAVVDQWALLDRDVIVTAGLRQDHVRNYLGGDPAATTPPTGFRAVDYSTGLDVPTAPFQLLSAPGGNITSAALRSYGIVAHSPEVLNRRLPWGLQVSVFFNRSQNFRPVNRTDINGQAAPPPSGVTKDYGLILTALDGRVSLRVTHYQSGIHDATLSDNSVLTFMGDEVSRGIQFAKAVQNHAGAQGPSGNGLYAFRNTADPSDTTWYAYEPATGTAATWTTADWQAAETQAQAQAKALLDATLPLTQFLQAWTIRPEDWNATAANFGLSSRIPAGVAVTADTRSSGTEMELTLRPTENWDVALNAAKTSAARLALAGSLAAFIESRWALYAGPAGDLRWNSGFQAAIATNTGRARFGRNAWRWYCLYRSQEGNDVPELRPYRVNAVAKYRFNGGFGGRWLKGAFLGGAWRWQSRDIIGYGVSEVTPALGPSNPAIGKLDVTKPYHGPTESAVDFFAGYRRSISRATDWCLQLNVRNATSKARLVPINTNPDGSVAACRIADGATWEVTSTFRF
jgi:outer membrane receptor protein involved in Fe transport